MPISCCVPSCRYTGFRDEQGNKISFFSLPFGNKELLEKWLEAITRDEVKEMKELHSGSKVCSKHFDESDYYPGYMSGKRFLRDGCVPHIFTCRAPKSQRSDTPGIKSDDVTAATNTWRPPEKKLVNFSPSGTAVGVRVSYSSDQSIETDRVAPVRKVTVRCNRNWAIEMSRVATAVQSGDSTVEEIQHSCAAEEVNMDLMHNYPNLPEQSGDDIAEDISMDPAHTYCKPLEQSDDIPEEIKTGPVQTYCKPLEERTCSSLSAWGVQAMEESGNADSMSSPDTSGEHCLDTGMEVLVEDSTDARDTRLADNLPDAGCSGNICCSEAVSKVDKLEKLVFKLQREVERESALVASYQRAVNEAKEERCRLARAVELLGQKCQRLEKSRFSIENLRDSPVDFQFYTGLPEFAVFEDIFHRLDPGPFGDNVRPAGGRKKSRARDMPRNLTVRDEFFLFLVRCRLGLSNRDLAFRFSISRRTVIGVCTAWTRFVYLRLDRLLPDPSVVARNGRAPSVSSTRDTGDSEILGLGSGFPDCHAQSDSGVVVTVDSVDGATIFMYPPMDLASTDSAGHASNHQERQTGGSAETDCCIVTIEEVLQSVGVPANISLLLGRHRPGDSSVLQVEEVISLRRDIECTVPNVKNYRIFERPLPPCLLPVAKELLAVCTVLAAFKNSSFCAQDE